jgi:hypothetical protein
VGWASDDGGVHAQAPRKKVKVVPSDKDIVARCMEVIIKALVAEEAHLRRVEKQKERERERRAREKRQALIQARKNVAEIQGVVSSLVASVEQAARQEQRLSSREQARQRRAEASRKMVRRRRRCRCRLLALGSDLHLIVSVVFSQAEEAAARLRGNSSVVAAVRQARGPIRAIAYDGASASLIAVCHDHSLWRARLRRLPNTSPGPGPAAAESSSADSWESTGSEWESIGSALHVTCAAVSGSYLYVVDRANSLWRRGLGGEEDWVFWGKVGNKKDGGIVALSGDGGGPSHLLAVASKGRLLRVPLGEPASPETCAEVKIHVEAPVKGLASTPAVCGVDGSARKLLLAAAHDGELWWCDSDEASAASASASAAAAAAASGVGLAPLRWLSAQPGATTPGRAQGQGGPVVVAANGICTTESLIIGTDAKSIICCPLPGVSTVGGGGRGGGWWRALALPPVEPAAPRGAKKGTKRKSK